MAPRRRATSRGDRGGAVGERRLILWLRMGDHKGSRRDAPRDKVEACLAWREARSEVEGITTQRMKRALFEP